LINLENRRIIDFYRARGKYGFLSCLFKKPLTFKDRTFPTAEHHYVFLKLRDPIIAEWVMKAPKPHLVSIVSHGLFSWDIVPNWSKIKVEEMLNVLRAKFSDPELKERLLATGDAILREASKTDSFWGIGKNGKGKNMLGKLLMQVREEILEV